MSILSDKYYDKEKLFAIAKEEGIDGKYFDEFILYVENDIQQMYNDGDLSESEIGSIAIDNAVRYYTVYDAELQKGHSKDWANLYADNSLSGDEPEFYYTYDALKKNDNDLANTEIVVHCKASSNDQMYINAFVFLLQNLETPELIDAKATRYSEIYHRQIENSKSVNYAVMYSYLMMDNEIAEHECASKAMQYDDEKKYNRPANHLEMQPSDFAYNLANCVYRLQ